MLLRAKKVRASALIGNVSKAIIMYKEWLQSTEHIALFVQIMGYIKL